MSVRWRWRWGRQKDLLPTRRSSEEEDSEPLDNREQEALVRSFELKQMVQDVVWRGIFGALLIAYAAFFTYAARQQAAFPWTMRHHSDLRNVLGSRHVQLAEYAEAITCAGVALGVLFFRAKWHRQMLWASTTLSLVLAFFFIDRCLRLPNFRWQILWLPLGTPSLAGVSLYVDGILAETAKDIEALRASMYHYKRS